MKSTATSVESLCNLLGRSRLLKPAQVQTVYQQWRQVESRPSPGERDRFLRWLGDNHYVTAYQRQQLAVGQTHFFLNHYKLLDLIGQGRMAGIFKATHSLGHIVAIKVLPASKGRDPNVLLRFQREAKMAVRLKHPNIVRTFHLGNALARHYLVMEYLEGETLADVLERRKKLPHAEAVRLVHQALLGLQHIHQQGMIHRDLSPGNLMLTPPRPPGAPDDTLHATVKILDIGVGRILFDETVPGAGDVGPQLTTAGMMLGTATYMSPEQGRNAHSADIRSDIYSLGCVLYHVLTGRPPFTGERDFEIILQHLTQPPRPARELEPSVPAGLQAVLGTLLAKDPGQRYATPEKAAQALRPFLAAPERPGDQASSLTRSYLHWVEAQPLEEVDDKPLAVGRWYYSRDGLAIGPFPTAQLTQLAVAGKLGPSDLLWMEGDNPDLAIPARAAVDFSGLKLPPRPPRAMGLSAAETGHDPETGQIFDPVKFKNWQRLQKDKKDRELAAAPTVGEVFEKARTHIDRWLDFDRNRRPILAADMEFIRRDPDIQRFMQFHARYGPDMLHKLWHHLQFMVENRRKYYCALG